MTVCNQNRVDCARLSTAIRECSQDLNSTSCPLSGQLAVGDLAVLIQLVQSCPNGKKKAHELSGNEDFVFDITTGNHTNGNLTMPSETRAKRQLDKTDGEVVSSTTDAENLFMNKYMTVSC